MPNVGSSNNVYSSSDRLIDIYDTPVDKGRKTTRNCARQFFWVISSLGSQLKNFAASVSNGASSLWGRFWSDKSNVTHVTTQIPQSLPGPVYSGY